MVTLIGGCQDPVVIKVLLGTMAGSLYNWGVHCDITGNCRIPGSVVQSVQH